MSKWNRRNKSKSALGKIKQANEAIENLKNTTIGGLAEAVNTLSINYGLIYEGMQELSNDLSNLGLDYESLSNSSTSNTQQIQTINQSITTLNQKMNAAETSITNINQQIQSINQSITTLNQKVTALENK